MKQKHCMLWILAALVTLGLGQFLGLMLGAAPPEEKAQMALTAPDSEVVYGQVLRQEQMVFAPQPGSWETEKDGQRVSPGTVLFTLREGGEEARRIDEAAAEAGALALPRRRKNIHSAIAKAQVQGNTEMLMAMVLGENQNSLASPAQTDAPGSVIAAEVGGCFVSGRVQETAHPDWPELPEAAQGEGEVLGRIITGETWWFWGTFSERRTPGMILTGILPTGTQVELRVLRCEAGAEGGEMVLCACDTAVLEVARTSRLAIRISDG